MKAIGIVSFAIALVLAASVMAGGEMDSSEQESQKKSPNVIKYKVSELYSAAKTMSAKVKKTFTSGIMDSSDDYSGKLFIMDKMLRLELEGKAHTLQIFKDGVLTAVTFPPKGFSEGKVQVTKYTVNREAEAFQLISSLLQGKNLERNFKLISKKQIESDNEITMVPVKEGSGLTSVSLLIDSKNLQIKELSYKDDLENKVQYVFNDVQFDKKIDKKIFDYKAPKGSEESHF